jgi:large-conductance mechanosensitive channel
MNKSNFMSNIGANKETAKLVLAVIVGTELFNIINSLKLNMIMPTISNALNEGTVRGWSVGKDPFCFRYGNFLWDSLSVVVFLALLYVLWRFVVKRFVK